MRKWCIILIVLGVAFSGIASFFAITSGRVYSADGLKQNSRVYIENACYEDGKFTYTIVNKTFKAIVTGGVPSFQHDEGGQWESCSFYTLRQAYGEKIRPFSATEHTFSVESGITVSPGRYRMIYTAGSYSIVAYFDVE
ncbi:MAG: hypothetical protein E7590_00445 [Ruminococcaceae bacterium]|nr:hypothetical protein [Oscillospiraceae bacterium]